MVRQTIPGEKQFTTSILIVTKELPKKIVLLHHKKYNMWVQPGGHIEKFENPIETAIREAKEEAGIDISFLLKEIKSIDPLSSFIPVPDFFMEDVISPYQDTPEHFHLDFLYKISVPFQKIKTNKKEAYDIGWFTLKEALRLPMYENTKVIIQKALRD